MHEFQVKNLHLAAFIYANGGNFAGMNGRIFIFKSEHHFEYWKDKHDDSCCRRVDIRLMELRKLLPK